MPIPLWHLNLKTACCDREPRHHPSSWSNHSGQSRCCRTYHGHHSVSYKAHRERSHRFGKHPHRCWRHWMCSWRHWTLSRCRKTNTSTGRYSALCKPCRPSPRREDLNITTITIITHADAVAAVFARQINEVGNSRVGLVTARIWSSYRILISHRLSWQSRLDPPAARNQGHSETNCLVTVWDTIYRL